LNARSRPGRATILCVALAAAAAAARAEGPAPAAPAETPAAVVHGRPIPRAAVYAALADQALRGPSGDRRLAQYLAEVVTERERVRRGVVVGDHEVQAAWDKAEKDAAAQAARHGDRGEGSALERVLKETGATAEEFRRKARQYLALQKMACEDLSAPGEVPLPQIEVWQKDLLRRWNVTTDRGALGAGEVARIGEEPVSKTDFGRFLSGMLNRADVHGIVMEMAFETTVAARAETEGLALRAEDLDAEVARLRAEFAAQPGVRGTGVTFDGWLQQARGMTVAGLREDPSFRALLLARRIVARGIAPDQVRAEWEAHPERYGETARIRRILVRGEERASPFGASARPMNDARKIADRALDALESGRDFEEVARGCSEDLPPGGPRGQVIEVSRMTSLPTAVLDVVLKAKAGETLGPLRAVDGWHIVKIESCSPAPAFEQVAARVRADLESAAVRDLRLQLHSDPDVRVADDL